MSHIQHGQGGSRTLGYTGRRRKPHGRSKHAVGGLASLIMLVTLQPLAAQPARVWLSPSIIGSSGPEAQSISSVNGSRRFLHIWAQPAPQKTLQNWSLDLVADHPAIDFLDQGILVYNPALTAAAHRFQYVYDSSGEPPLVSDALVGTADRIRGLQGFSIDSAQGLGIGPSCHPNDRFCFNTPSGPAWLLASVPFRAVQSTGAANVFLQVGSNGINHANESSAATTIVFGAGNGPAYNAASDRGPRRGGDIADMTIMATNATDVHWLGGSGNWTDSNWSNQSGAPSWSSNVFLDSSLGVDTVSVVGPQYANVSTVNGGRLHIGSGASLTSDVAVNSGGAISGSGWIASGLALAGTLVIDSTQPLMVAGTANVEGGRMALATGYSQPPNSVSAPFVVLESLGGIQGMLSTAVGAPLGGGASLYSIEYAAQQIAIRVQFLPGDFDNNGVVDAADYVVWRNAVGQSGWGLAADGNGDGQIDPSDYSVWKANFGATVVAAAAATVTAVPEPATARFWVLGLWLLVRRRIRTIPTSIVIIGYRAKSSIQLRRLVARFLLAGIIADAARSALAINGTWTNATSGGSWSTTTNWAGNTVANGTDAFADFGTLNITADNTVHLNSARVVGHLRFADTALSNNWFLDNNGNSANTLTLAVSAGVPSINVENQTATISAALVGPQGIIKQGVGILVLTGANIYAGGTFLDAGILTVSSDSNLGGPTSGLQFGGGMLRAADNFVLQRNVILLPVGGIVDTNSFSVSFPGFVVGSGSLHKAGNGYLTLTNNNPYTGGTIISGGALVIGADYTLGSGALTLDGGTLQTTASFVLQRNVVLAAGGAIDTNGQNVSLPGFITGPGRLVKGGGGTLTLTNSNSYTGGTVIVNGTLSIGADYTLGSGNLTMDAGLLQTTGSFALQRNVLLLPGGGTIDTSGFDVSMPGFTTGSGRLTKTGSGILTLTNTATYSGGTTIDGGTLNFATPAALPTSGNFIVNAGAKLFLGQPGNLFSYGTPSQSVTLNNGTLEFGNTQGPFTLSDWRGSVALVGTSTISSVGGPVVLGQITGPIAGSGELHINGTIKLASANSFTGDTRIVGGGLLLGHSDALLTSTLHLFAGDTGGFSFDKLTLARFGGLTGTRNLVLQNEDAAPVALFVGYNGASNHYNGVLIGSGQLIKTGSGRQTLNSANTFTGDSRIEDGVLVLGNANALANSTLHMFATDIGSLSFGSLTSATLGGLAGTRDLVLQNDGSAAVYLAIGNNNASNNYNGRLSGSGALAKTGTGTQTLNGNNNFTGGTTIFSGALAGDTASLQGAIAIAGGAQLILQQPADGTFVGNIEGAGSVVKNGAGTLTISGNHLYTGGTTINGGTLAVDPSGSSILGPVTVGSGATLTGRGSIGGSVNITTGGSLQGKLAIQGNVTNSGTVAPGFSPEIINVSGDYTQAPGGVLEIEIGGPTPGTQHDQLNVAGTASLAGRLEVPFVDSYMGSRSDEIIFLSAAQVVGRFDQIVFENVEILSPNLHPLVIQSRTDVRVIFLGTEPLEDYLLRGDMNNDGHVNALDVPLFAKALLNPDAYDAANPVLGVDYRPIVGNADTHGDMDFDDIDDFVAMLEPGPGASFAAVLAAINAELHVPEPASMLLFLWGSCLSLAVRFRSASINTRSIAAQSLLQTG